MSPAGVVVRPDVPVEVGMLTGFGYTDQGIAAGAEAAREALPRLRQILA